MLDIAVEDKNVSKVIKTICKNARTGEIGDGKIFVLPIEEALRIRTFEIK